MYWSCENWCTGSFWKGCEKFNISFSAVWNHHHIWYCWQWHSHQNSQSSCITFSVSFYAVWNHRHLNLVTVALSKQLHHIQRILFTEVTHSHNLSRSQCCWYSSPHSNSCWWYLQKNFVTLSEAETTKWTHKVTRCKCLWPDKNTWHDQILFLAGYVHATTKNV